MKKPKPHREDDDTEFIVTKIVKTESKRPKKLKIKNIRPEDVDPDDELFYK